MKTKEERKAYDAARYAANSEKVKAYNAAYYAANPEKMKAKNVAYYAANAEEIKAKNAAWRAANREKVKAYEVTYRASGKSLTNDRMRKYGLSPEAYQLILSAQKSACGICKEIFSEEPQVDHDHATGEVRGLLCRRCNVSLGGFRDSTEVLENAKKYLNQNKTKI